MDHNKQIIQYNDHIIINNIHNNNMRLPNTNFYVYYLSIKIYV